MIIFIYNNHKMNIVRQLNIIKRNLFILHHPSKKLLLDTDNYTDYTYPYDNKTDFVLSLSKPTDHIQSTFIRLNNLQNVSDIYYLDSYLSTFKNSLNTVSLLNPHLSNVYMYLQLKNIYHTQNEFIIYNLDNKDNKLIQKLNEINKQMGRKIWKLMD